MMSNRSGGVAKKNEYVITRNTKLYINRKATYFHGHYLNIKYLNNNDLCFTIVRDPFKRLVSRYNMDLYLYRNNKLSAYGREYMSKFIEDFKMYFNNLKNTEPKSYLGIINTFSHISNINDAIKNAKKFTYILHTEQLQNDFIMFIKLNKIALPNKYIKLPYAKKYGNIIDNDILQNIKDYLSFDLKIEYELCNILLQENLIQINYTL